VGQNYGEIITNAIIVSLRKDISTKEQCDQVMRKEVCAEMFWVSLGMEYINAKSKRFTSTLAIGASSVWAPAVSTPLSPFRSMPRS
jgi:hypothetical protein